MQAHKTHWWFHRHTYQVTVSSITPWNGPQVCTKEVEGQWSKLGYSLLIIFLGLLGWIHPESCVSYGLRWSPIWGNLYYYSMVSLYPHYLSLACCRWVTISQFPSLTLHLFCTDLRTIPWCNTTHSNLVSMSMEPSVSSMSLHGVMKRLGEYVRFLPCRMKDWLYFSLIHW